MARLSMDKTTFNNSEQYSEIINNTGNNENIILICFDPNKEINDFNNRFKQIHNNVIFHIELESCIINIQSLHQTKIILITSNTFASQLLSHTIIQHQLHSFFIFCLNTYQDEHLFISNCKVTGIYDNINLLCTSIEKQINLINKQNSIWCLFDQNQFENRDLSKQANDFLWLQLFHHVLLHLSDEQQGKRQRIFEDSYESTQPIQRILKNVSLQKMINKALRHKDITYLYTLKYFLADLLQNLAQEHQRTVGSNRRKLIVYRGMKLSKDELKELKENEGKLISMKEFMMTSTDQLSALSMLTSSSSFIEQSQLINVLIEIECNLEEVGDNLIFVDISQFTDSSSSSEEIILFDFNTTFRLESIRRDEQMWIIKLNAVNDGRSILQKYIDDTHRQIEDLSIPIIFGKLLCDMNEWNLSQEYFEHLINDSSDEDVTWIEHSIGQAHQWKGEWKEAREYYDRAYNRMMTKNPVRVKESAIILSDIGEILYLQGKYEEAYDFHQRALIIQKEYRSSNHPHIATCLKNMGLIHYRRQEDNEAMALYKQALKILEEYYDYAHIEVANILSNIGNISGSQENYDEALTYHQRALTIYKKYYPLGHFYIASILNRISFIFRRQEKYEESLSLVQEALTMQKRFYPFGHIDITNSLRQIGRIRYREKKYDESLGFCQEMLILEKKYYSSNHLDTVLTLNIIGYTQLYGKNNNDKALDYHQQALQILETCYPSYHGHIAMTLNYIGDISKIKNNYEEALDFYHRALKMQEDYYSADHTDMTTVLGSISQTLSNQGKYDEAVAYLQRALTIREKYHPPYHMNIVINLKIIAYNRLKQRKFDDAFDSYQRALIILEQYHPMNINQIISCLEAIANVFCRNFFYNRSIEYFESCLRISEASLPYGHSTIVRTLSNLSLLQRNQDKYELSLAYEMKCFSMREKVLPLNHQDIGKSLHNIGTCYYELNQRRLALEYYKQALIIYQECLPFSHEDRKRVELKIKQLSEEIELIDI